MHEMGIAASVLDAVREEATRRPGSHPTRVGLRIGEWAGVDTESLRFCFEAMITRTDLDGLALDIDYRERRNRCLACGAEFRVTGFDIQCPSCHSEVTEPSSGSELEIAFVELED